MKNRGAGKRFLWLPFSHNAYAHHGSFSLVIFIILTVALSSLLSCGEKFPEIATLRDLQTIAEAQAQYLSKFGRYASTLAELGPTRGAGLIPAKLASGELNGYLFTLTSTPGGEVVNALPKNFWRTRRRTFYLDQNGVDHENWGPKPATTASPEP